MDQFNNKLKRLLWLHFGENPDYPKECEPLFQMISDAFDSDEQEYALLNRIMDLSSKELFDANTELRKRNQELDSLVYTTTHDLRAPLTSILGLLDLIEIALNEEEKADFLAKIKSSAIQLDYFIRDIVDYTHNKKASVLIQEVDFEALIEKCFKKLEFMRNASHVKKQVSIQSTTAFYSDPKRLENLLSNLISNSIKYYNPKAEEPAVELIVSEQENGVNIVCQDNGIGIKKEHHEQVFDMFYRASSTSKGSGIGLYIVREIVEKLGGNISMTSELGIGTTFHVFLPNKVTR